MIEYANLTESNLESALGVMNLNLEFDNTTTLDLLRYKTLDDPDYDPSLGVLALADGEPCGFMFAVVRTEGDKKVGGLKFFAVDEAFRNRGIASEMLRRIEEGVRTAGARSMRIGFIRPNYLMPGVDPRYTVACAFLLRRGFKRAGEAFNMDVELDASDWSTDQIEARLAQDGIIVRRLRSDECEKLRQWMIEDGWSAGWQYQTLRSAEMDPIAVFVGERATGVSGFERGEAERKSRNTGAEFVAFACYDGVRPGWFGPMGTSESMRGTGIGSVTFLKCLQDMKAKGYRVCEINSVGPLYFYSKAANAVVSRIFWQFEKELKAKG